MRKLKLVPTFAPRGSGLLVDPDELGEVAYRSAVDRLERILDEAGDLDEADAAGEERVDGDLVGGVERARVCATPLAGFACEREERKSIEIGRLELERQPR